LYDGDSRNTDISLVVRTGIAAAELISGFAGIYLPWVGEVIKDLIPLPPRPGILHSASGKLAPGIISVTNQDLRCALAEQLVHEATHQHLYLLTRLGPMDDGSDETLYFSPFRNMGRPVFYILFAYHAFANVLLFYRTARANGMSDGEPGITDQDKLKADLLTLEEALETTKALTPLGRALWEPLREMVHQ
jgi:HEXXH motif-containing protein